jgi:hypothetical protein
VVTGVGEAVKVMFEVAVVEWSEFAVAISL